MLLNFRRNPSAIALFAGTACLYVLLDWVSHIHPYHQLNITPWSPAAGLALVLLLRRPAAGAATLFFAVVAAEVLIRHGWAGWSIALLAAFALTLGYSALAAAIRHLLPGGALFSNSREFLLWLLAIVAGTPLNSLLFILTMGKAGLIPPDAWAGAVLRHWIGDLVGIVVFMPLFWLLAEERQRKRLRTECLHWETAGYIGLALGIACIGFSLGPAAASKYFYFLFLPVIWAAFRQGLAGAAIGAAAVQIMIIAAVETLGFQELPVFELQLLALVLATVGLVMGIAIEERRQVSDRLRQTLRLAAAGEMAAALAHELNQPLTALNAYGSACEHLLARGETGPILADAIRRMSSEATRAGDVLRRLRDFFRTGTTRLETTGLDDLLANAVDAAAPRAAARGISLLRPPATGFRVLADSLQLEVVLRNLLTNAIDSAETSADERWIAVGIERPEEGKALLVVEDSGPGIREDIAAHLFEPFVTSKSKGLGLGLAISRAIVEAHGGNLWAEPGEHGCFKLTLPLEGKHE